MQQLSISRLAEHLQTKIPGLTYAAAALVSFRQNKEWCRDNREPLKALKMCAHLEAVETKKASNLAEVRLICCLILTS